MLASDISIPGIATLRNGTKRLETCPANDGIQETDKTNAR